MAVNDTFAGRPMLGRYVLVREIARSNDVVWEATDPQMNRRVAVKELALPPTLTGQARRERIERFYREARAAGAMSHANIVTIYEVGEMDGRYFIAMEFLEGQTLRERLAVSGTLPIGPAVDIASALCDALSYAHGRGVIHRDIKPDNVHLLPDGRVKLTDFGIARITHEDSLTVDGQVFGTPSYMSPEQVIGRAIDARSDIFSLGIVVYEMLSGRKPFTGESVVTITYRIMNDEMPPLPGAPGLDAVLRRALAKKPEERYATVNEFRSALVAAAHQQDALHPLPGSVPSSSVPQMTVGYSSLTRRDLLGSEATVLPSAPSAVEGTWISSMPPPRVDRSRRNLVTVLLSILLIAGCIVGGAWVLSQAYQSQMRQARARSDARAYQKAVDLYNAGAYEQAATAFEQLRRSSRDPTTIRDATISQGICYRALGGQFVRQNNLIEAETWFRQALTAFQDALRLAPNDAQARQGFSQASKELNDVLKARGASPEMMVPDLVTPGGNAAASSPPATLPGRAVTVAPSGPRPDLSAADVQNANAAKAAEAARLLQEGNAAWQQGDKEGAARLWNQAVQAGPGSDAAGKALVQFNAYTAGKPPW